MNRRKFLTLSACFAGFPATGRAQTWRGRALGSDVSVTLTGPQKETTTALADIPRWLDAIESEFSLYRDSTLTRLNAKGIWHAGGMFNDLLRHCHMAWKLTDGLFDPTVQPLWQALAFGKNTRNAQQLIGWERVSFGFAEPVKLQPGQQLTFNGIAQGYATETIAGLLAGQGFTKALINIGEQQAIGGPFTVAIEDPSQGHLGQRGLTNLAIATSSPGAMALGERAHILAPDGRKPVWSTVNIEAKSATLADALSTAAVFMDTERLKNLKIAAGLTRITTADFQGNLRSL